MHFECLLFYNFRFMNSNCGCTQSSTHSTQHLPQLTIINVVFLFLLYFFILQSVRNENTVSIAMIIIIMPHPINSFLAGNVEGQNYFMSWGLRGERFIDIGPQDIRNN